MTLAGLYLRSLGYLAARRGTVGLIVLANVVLAAISVAEPIVFGRIVDAISASGSTGEVMAAWIGFALFSTVASVLVARQADRLAHSTRAAFMERSYGRLLAMPLSWHARKGSSNVLHTLLRASDTLFGLWLEFMRSHLATAVALFLLVPTAAVMDLRLTAVLLALGVAYCLVQKMVMSKTRSGQAAVEGHYHTVFAHVSDTMTNVSVVHGYNRIRAETEALRGFVSRLLDAQYPVLDWWALASALNRVASTLSMLVILIVGAGLVRAGEMKVGEIIAFIGFANLMIGRLDQMRQFATQTFEAKARLDDFYEMEDAAAAQKDEDDAIEMAARGKIEFEHVSFDFPGSTQGVKDVSFVVEPGTTVAIVGPTGSGKTTLVNLLQGVHEPQAGVVRIDGVDVRSIRRESVRDNIATVFQEAGLLNRSIRDNVMLGRPTATESELKSAAAAAVATGFIEDRPAGWETMVGERGGALSGGERQRLAIARAILKNAPILVLDEATSALDVETEARVKEAVDALRNGRTTFVIAHRLSTIREADVVLFLDHGRIVEMGGYDDLAAAGGRFAQLLAAGGAQFVEMAKAA
jgi:ATP-binding cassette subfamily B protein